MLDTLDDENRFKPEKQSDEWEQSAVQNLERSGLGLDTQLLFDGRKIDWTVALAD